jgi:STE24 endopeptidase
VSSPDRFFTPEELERSRRYHRPLYLAHALDLALALVVLGLLAAYADWTVGPWWLAAAVLTVIAVTTSALVRLPVSFWTGFLYERRWGFSTQSARGWAADFLRKVLLASVFGVIEVVGLVALARAFPSWWPAVAAPPLALFVLVVTFVAPLVLEPIFNRFAPLADPELAGQLRALAARAGLPVREVLVCDASRRTTKLNAYVSGLGSTRRIVLFDTLLRRAGRAELELVLAHELGHRRAGHIVKGTVLGMAGAVVGTLIVWAAVEDPRDPTVAPLVLFLTLALELVALPFWTALARRWEREADRYSLELTSDRDAFVSVHRELAAANLSDLDPPRLVYRLLFTHPTPAERIASAG